MATVFISYNASDRDWAARLAGDLTNAGIDVWYDRQLKAGQNWQREIETNLRIADLVIVLVSPASLQSKWVQIEWQAALARSTRVIPALIDGASFGDLPPLLNSRVGINLADDYAGGLRALVDVAHSLQVSSEPPATDSLDVPNIVEDVIEQVMSRLGVNTTKAAPTTDAVDDRLVFVICSFDASMEPTFEAIEAAAKAVGLRAMRVKDRPGDYRITEAIFSMLRSARFVVCDLTHERPNVYFELGYARGIGKTVVTTLRRDTKVHFDVYDWTHIEYIDSRPLERDLVDRFRFEMSTDPGSAA